MKKELTLNKIKILCCLKYNSMSGKEILLNLEERKISIKPGSIYLCLYKLEEDKYVKSTERIERKLRYEITKKGHLFLEKEFELLLKIYKDK